MSLVWVWCVRLADSLLIVFSGSQPETVYSDAGWLVNFEPITAGRQGLLSKYQSPRGFPKNFKDFKGHEQRYDGRHWSTSLVFLCLESWSRSMDHQGQLNDLSLYLQRLCKAQFGGVRTTCFLIPEMGIPRPNLCHSRHLVLGSLLIVRTGLRWYIYPGTSKLFFSLLRRSQFVLFIRGTKGLNTVW